MADGEEFIAEEEVKDEGTPLVDVSPDVTPGLSQTSGDTAYTADAVRRAVVTDGGGGNNAIETSGDKRRQEQTTAERRKDTREIAALATEAAYRAAYTSTFSAIGQKAEKALKVEKTKLADMRKSEALMRAQIAAMQDVYSAQIAYDNAQKHYTKVLEEGKALTERADAVRGNNIKEFSDDLKKLQKAVEDAPLKAKEALEAAKNDYFTVDDKTEALKGPYAHEVTDDNENSFVYLVYRDGKDFYQVYAEDKMVGDKASYDLKERKITDEKQLALLREHAAKVDDYKNNIEAAVDSTAKPKDFIPKSEVYKLVEAKAIAQKEYTEHMYKTALERFHESGIEQQVEQFQQKIEDARKAVEDCKRELDEKLAYAQSLGADLNGKTAVQIAEEITQKQQELKTLQENIGKQEYMVSQYEAIIAFAKSPEMKKKLEEFIKNDGIANYKDLDDIPGLTDDNFKAGIVADLEKNDIKVEGVPPEIRKIVEGIKAQKAEDAAKISNATPAEKQVKHPLNNSVANAVNGPALPGAPKMGETFAAVSAAPGADVIQPAPHRDHTNNYSNTTSYVS